MAKAARNVLNLLNPEHSCIPVEIPGWHRAPSTASTCGSLGDTWIAVSAAAKSLSAGAELVQGNGLLNYGVCSLPGALCCHVAVTENSDELIHVAVTTATHIQIGSF